MNTPKYAKKMVRLWMEKMTEHPMFTTPEKMLVEREAFLNQLLVELRNMEVKRLECPSNSPRLSSSSIQMKIETPDTRPPELGL